MFLFFPLLTPIILPRSLPFSLCRPSPCYTWSALLCSHCPSGVQVNAALQSLFDSFHMMWPMNFPLLLQTPSLRFSILAICRNPVLLVYLKYPSKTSALEDIDFVFSTFIHLPVVYSSRFPFFGSLTISPFLHFLGVFFSLHIRTMITLILGDQ